MDQRCRRRSCGDDDTGPDRIDVEHVGGVRKRYCCGGVHHEIGFGKGGGNERGVANITEVELIRTLVGRGAKVETDGVKPAAAGRGDEGATEKAGRPGDHDTTAHDSDSA